jgi:hypothetical protein
MAEESYMTNSCFTVRTLNKNPTLNPNTQETMRMKKKDRKQKTENDNLSFPEV